MPVKGLSERLRLPRLGKIRLGEKKISEKTGKEYPSALDYFVVPEQVKALYGEKPRQLDIMLPMEDKEVFFPVWFKRYGSSKGLICKGDGEQATEIDEESGDMKEIECPGKACQYFQDGSCKTVGNLQVVLHKVPGLGIYQIDTSSYNSILNLNSSVEMIRGMLGRVSWVPLILKVEMQEAHPRVNNKRIKTIVPMMSLTADVSVESILEDVRKGKVRLPEPKEAKIVNPKVDEKEDLLYPGKDGNLPKEGKDVSKKTTQDEDTGDEADKKLLEKAGELEREASQEEPAKEETKEEPSGQTEEEKKRFDAEVARLDKECFGDQDEQEKPAPAKEARGRNQLNVVWHKVKKQLIKECIWNDKKYRAWLKIEFDVDSSKELTKEQMEKGIELMSSIYNEETGGEEE